MTTKDLENKELILITDYNEILELEKLTGIDLSEYRCLFVKEDNGEIVEIYACVNSVPYLDKNVYKIL